MLTKSSFIIQMSLNSIISPLLICDVKRRFRFTTLLFFNFTSIIIGISRERILPFLKGLSAKALFSYDRQIYDAKEWQLLI